MPSVLVETGYITNKTEEDYLNSKEGQAEIASCVTNAVGNYITWLEKQQLSSGAQTRLQKAPSKEVFSFLSEIDKQERQRKGLTK
jgi:N-acetylmuramoyl-L-alanine amidase